MINPYAYYKLAKAGKFNCRINPINILTIYETVIQLVVSGFQRSQRDWKMD